MTARRLAFVLGPVLGIVLLIAAGSLAWWAPFAWTVLLIVAVALLIWLQSGEQQPQAEER